MKVRGLTLICSTHFIEVDYIQQSIEISESKFLEIKNDNLYSPPIEFNKQKMFLPKEEPLVLELSDFLSSINLRKQPLVKGSDGIRAVDMAQQAFDSLMLNKQN